MKRSENIIKVLMAVLAVSGCIRDDIHDEYPIPVTNEWYRIVTTDTISTAQMISSISGSFSIPLGPDMVHTSFQYHSVNGSDTVTLSGAVCWPVGMEICSAIWLDSHIFSTGWHECPSQTPQPGMIISSCNNYVFIGADYQGQGLSRNLPHPYLNTVLKASQSIDCFKAALTLIRDTGPTLERDYDTYNVGYSLGGAVAMGIARQVELNPQLQSIMHIRKSFCGGGPYDQNALFRHFLKTPDENLDYPIEFLCAVISLHRSYNSCIRQYSYSSLFTDKLLNSGVIEQLETHEYTTSQINNMLSRSGCTSLRDILTPQVLNQESEVYRDIIDEIKKLDLTTEWSPSIPILFRHSKADTYVPIECMESVQANMHDNPNITYQTIESGSHFEEGIRFYISFLAGAY